MASTQYTSAVSSTSGTSNTPRQVGAPGASAAIAPLSDKDADGKIMYQHLQRPFELTVDLRSVAVMNRSIEARYQMAYPDKLLRAMVEAKSRVSGFEVPTADCSTFTVSQGQKGYVCVEKNNRVLPFLNVIGSTIDLRLINELALEKFRDAVYKHFPNLTEGMQQWTIEGQWVMATGDIRGVSRLAWWVDNDGCVSLSAAMPGTDYQLDIRVSAGPLTPGVHNIQADGGMVSNPTS